MASAIPCSNQVFSYLIKPTIVVAYTTYETDVLPKCDSQGRAPIKLHIEVSTGTAPYTGNLVIYVDDVQYDVVYVSGTLDYIVWVAPGTHSIKVATPDGNAIMDKQVEFRCQQ